MPMKIFVLEDDPPAAKDLMQQLEKWGHSILYYAKSYQQAVQWLEQTEELPDAAILDLCLGNDDNRQGLDVAEMIAEKYHVPFIFYSALEDTSTARLTARYKTAQIEKGAWRTLKNELIHIEENKKQARKGTKLPPLTQQESYETACISINNTENRNVKIPISIANIVWIDTQPNRSGRIILHVAEGDRIVSYNNNNHTLDSFVQALDERYPHLNLSSVFIRIHKSTIINRHYIMQYTRDSIWVHGKYFPIGNQYQKGLEKYLPPTV